MGTGSYAAECLFLREELLGSLPESYVRTMHGQFAEWGPQRTIQWILQHAEDAGAYVARSPSERKRMKLDPQTEMHMRLAGAILLGPAARLHESIDRFGLYPGNSYRRAAGGAARAAADAQFGLDDLWPADWPEGPENPFA